MPVPSKRGQASSVYRSRAPGDNGPNRRLLAAASRMRICPHPSEEIRASLARLRGKSHKLPLDPPARSPAAHLCVSCKFDDPQHCRSGATHPPLLLRSLYIVSVVLGRAKIGAVSVRLFKPEAGQFAVCVCAGLAHAAHLAWRVVSAPRKSRAYTSHNVIASRSEVIGSRFGMNSCAMKPVWPVPMIASTIAGQFSSCRTSNSLRPGTPPVW